MKKLFVLLVMFLFVFSTISMAEDDNEASDDSSGSDQERERTENTERTQISDESKRKMIEQYNLRRKATQEVKDARLELVKARQEYKNVKESYQVKKQEVSRLKNQYEKCKLSEA